MSQASSNTPDLTDELAHARLVDRLSTRARRAQVAAALRSGRVRLLETVDLLAPESLPDVARRSLVLLLVSGAGFVGLELAARVAGSAGPLLGAGSPLLRAGALVLANAAAYIVMVPLHEAVHAGVILWLGGQPRFGLKLPFAAYCTAPGQLFTRAGYTAIALAPLVILSALGIALIWQAPDVGACVLFGLAGNVAGAVGDLDAVARIRRLPSRTLIADTATGYQAVLPLT
jgi:hypothetical protein